MHGTNVNKKKYPYSSVEYITHYDGQLLHSTCLSFRNSRLNVGKSANGTEI